MPRGRPKKNKTEPFKLVDEPKVQNETLENANDTLDDTLEDKPENKMSSNNIEPTEQTEKGRKPNSKKYPLCTRCGKDIVSTNPFRVNLAYLTSVASYHREVENDVPTLCNECAKGLSDVVDKYLINGGAKCKFNKE